MKKRVVLCLLLSLGISSMFALNFTQTPSTGGANFLNSGLIISGRPNNGKVFSYLTSLGYANINGAGNVALLGQDFKMYYLASGFSTWFNTQVMLGTNFGYLGELYFGKTWILDKHRLGVGGGLFWTGAGGYSGFVGGGAGLCLDYAVHFSQTSSFNIVLTENIGGGDVFGGPVLNVVTLRFGFARVF